MQNLFRKKNLFLKNIRAPKKQVVKASQFRINILKEGKDPILKPDSEYPIWLHELTIPNLNLSEKEGNWLIPNSVNPEERDMKSYRKLIRRYKMKYSNYKTNTKLSEFDDDKRFHDDFNDPEIDGGYGSDQRPYDIHRGEKPQYYDENMEYDEDSEDY